MWARKCMDPGCGPKILRNLPTMMVQVERSVHCNIRLRKECLLCESAPKMLRHL